MGRLRSEARGFDTTTGEAVSRGFVMFDGEKVTTSEPSMLLTEMATSPILVGGATVYPEDEPEKFVRSLHLAYRGSYGWATPAEPY